MPSGADPETRGGRPSRAGPATVGRPMSPGAEPGLRLSPVRVSAGEVVYPPGGRLGPRRQHDVELVLVHSGSARIAVDGVERPLLNAGWVGLLVPGHRESFAFADGEPTHHSWVQARLDDPRKNWKFESADLEMRKKWPQFMRAYEDALNCCSTSWAPWHIVPADRKWYRDYVIARTVVDALENLKLKWPQPREDLSKVKVV